MTIGVVNVRGLKNNPSEALAKAEEGPVIVLKGDTPTALLISLHDLDADRNVRVDIARALYEAEVLTLGKAAQVAGMSYGDFITYLSGLGIPVIRYSVDELKRELEQIKEW